MIPSRARFSGISHKDIGGGITSHRYCFEYCTRTATTEELGKRIRFNGQVSELINGVQQVEI